MKKKLILVCVILFSLTIVVAGTLAFITEEEQIHNVITTAGIGIQLIEKTVDEGGAEVDFPEEGIDGVMPGTYVDKIVTVNNDGAAEAWIRIKAEEVITSYSGETLPRVLDSGISVLILDINFQDWIRGGDGYYYYKYPVPAGSSTSVFFEKVGFAPEMGNEYQDCTVNIIVTAQAVQTANNPIPDGGDVTDVQGWPQEVTE